MANHKSAIKRAKQAEVKNIRNRSVKTKMRNIIKSVRDAVAGGNQDGISGILNQAKSEIARAAKKGVIHNNTASRKISRLDKLVNKLAA